MTCPFTILDPGRSVRELLMLFTLPPAAANRDPENFFNPEITNVEITINGFTNKVFAQDFKKDQMWIEIKILLLSEYSKLDGQSNMTLSTFYRTPTSSGYYFWLDFRITDDNTLHGNEVKIEPGSNVALNFTKNNTGSGKINLYTYLIADTSFSIINRYASDPQYC